jgi:hypothetical protein
VGKTEPTCEAAVDLNCELCADGRQGLRRLCPYVNPKVVAQGRLLLVQLCRCMRQAAKDLIFEGVFRQETEAATIAAARESRADLVA